MENRILYMNSKLDEHRAILKNMSNLQQDMRDYLSVRDILIYVNCNNINLNIDSRINKLIFKNCSNITVSIGGLISGLEVKGSNNIIIDCKKKNTVNSIVVEKSSNIQITMSKKIIGTIYYDIDSSRDIKILDKRNKEHLVK